MGARLGRARGARAEQMVLELPVAAEARKRARRPDNYVKTSRYTVYNFLIKCTLEQFRNLSNVYFLCIVVLALLGTHTDLFESPYSASGTLLGLLLVVGFTMAFEGYYDIKRHREDREVNGRTAFRLRPGDGHVEEIPWSDVRPGDLLKVHDRSQFPADLLFVTSLAAGHKCYVETANIDGETNLKIKHVPKDLVDRCILPDQAASLNARVVYDAPNAFLTFSGYIQVYDDEFSPKTAEGYKQISLETANILLRGSVLRNTPWVLGIVLYAGPETKVVQSSSDAPTKRSRIQKLINKIIILILFVDLVMCTVSAIVEMYGFPSNTMFYYLKQDAESTFRFPPFVANVCIFIVLYSSLLPISLLFCMTFSNFWQAMFVHWDLDMYHKETDTPAKCNTMELVQELGQVSYLFSDKTGTLTRNEMKLVGCTVLGRTYGVGSEVEGTSSSSDSSIREIFADVLTLLARSEPGSADRRALFDFFMILAVCHTVLVDTTSGAIQYNAEGPDEEALVSATADLGIRLTATDNGTYTVHVDFTDEAFQRRQVHLANPDDGEEELSGERFDFEILATNHFNSTRKRMSVVCRDPSGRTVLFVKGADTMMFELARECVTDEEVTERGVLLQHLDAFANDGLRTLVMARRELGAAEFEEWKTKYDAASSALGEARAKLMEDAAADIERDLHIVGASAIEDRLQDGVPETLVALREAGVKTWVLTGDKVETAINIAFSARLFTPEMKLIHVTSDSNEDNLETLRELQSLLVPENLAKDSEKRRHGRDVEREESHRRLLNDGPSGMFSRAMHGVTSSTVSNLERAGRSTLNLGRAALSVVTLKQFRSPSESGEVESIGGFGNSPSNRRTGERRAASDSEPLTSVLEDIQVRVVDDSERAGSVMDLSDDEGVASPRDSSTMSRSRSITEPNVGHAVSNSSSIKVKKRRSIPSISKFLSGMSFSQRDGGGSAVNSPNAASPQNHESRGSSVWRVAEQHLPEGVDAGEQRVNQCELKGNEKNLDGFEAQNMALIVSGPALVALLSAEKGSEETESILLSIAKLCSVVVACRVSPKQKALIVRMVKRGVRMEDGSSPITLAIGDGANDVAMIQEARVGVGISGHEGRQAVNSADFAIAQFRFLQQLMLVHGRWNYRRAASAVLFVFYANILFVLTAFVYNYFNKFSGSALFWVFLTTVYSYPTQVPIAVIACLNQDISRKTALEYPAMYISGRKNLHLDKGSAIEYIFKAFVHAFLISAVSIAWAAPSDVDISVLGTTVYMACIYVCVSRSCLETYTWTWLNFGVILFGYLSMLVFEPIYYGSDPTIFVRFGPSVLWASGNERQLLWSTTILVTAMCTVYDMVALYIRKEFHPNLVDVVIEIDRGFGDDSGNRKSRLGKINRLFRKIAQPLTIPQNAISELLATANLKNIQAANKRSAFDYDHPEDEHVLSLVTSLLRQGVPSFRHAVSLRVTDTGAPRQVVAKSAPVKRVVSSSGAATVPMGDGSNRGEVEMALLTEKAAVPIVEMPVPSPPPLALSGTDSESSPPMVDLEQATPQALEPVPDVAGVKRVVPE